MKSDFICWCLLTSFIGVFADNIMVEEGSFVLLFENVTADNEEKEVSLFVSGVKDPTLVVTFEIVNGYITMAWKSDNYRKIFMDAKRNIWIANVDETYERKYYIQSSKRREVELTILKTNYSTTKRTTLKENTQKGDALPERWSSETGCEMTSVVLMVIIMEIILMMIIILGIVKKHHIFAWIQCKKNNSVTQPMQITSHHDGPYSTSYLLMWNKPDDGGSQLMKYILKYQEVEIFSRGTQYELSRPLSEFISVDNILPSAVSYKLSPLMPGRYYQVEIQAINNQGQSLPQSFIFKTKEDIPQSVQVISHRDSPNPTSYLLMWDKPDDGGSLLQKYIIRHREVEIISRRTEYELSRPLSEFTYVDNILPSAVSYRLSPLMPGRYYQVEIQAINTNGKSLPQSFIFKTKGCVPQPVHVISHQDSPNPTSYILKWEKPDDGGSPLLKYILIYQNVEIIPNRIMYELSRPLSAFVSVDNILPSAVSYTLSPLKPGRYYQVEIQAINNQGQSLPQSFIFKTKEGVPPPVQVTSHHDSPNSTSYLLMWNKPDDEGSLPQKYILKYRNVEIFPNRTEYELSRPLSEFISVDNIPPSALCIRLTPLMPGRYYQVEIQAINTQGQSAPQSFIFKTKEVTPKRIDNEVQTDLQLPLQQALYVPGTNKTMLQREEIAHPTEETNAQLSTDVKFSDKIQFLHPRENTEHSTDICSMPGCSVMQPVGKDNQNPEEDKGQTESIFISVESPAEQKEDSDSDDECNMPLLSINPKKSKDNL